MFLNIKTFLLILNILGNLEKQFNNKRPCASLDGHVGIGGDPVDNTSLNVAHTNDIPNSYALRVYKSLNFSGQVGDPSYALKVNFEPDYTWEHLYAISGCAYRGDWPAPQDGRTIGVMGTAGNASCGWNYGVYGRLLGYSPQYMGGAAIFATIPGRDEINVNGTWAGYFRGNVKVEDVLVVNTTSYTSDITLKKDISELENNTLDKLMQLNPIRYRLKSPLELNLIGPEVTDTLSTPLSLTDREAEIYNRERFGLSAQEVEKLFPEIVIEGDDGFLGVNYIELIPILIEALKDQQRQINDLHYTLIADGRAIDTKRMILTD